MTKVEGRVRAGCLAHARRKLFEAKEQAPEEVRVALELILDIYEVDTMQRVSKSSEPMHI